MNNTAEDISESEVGGIHDITLEKFYNFRHSELLGFRMTMNEASSV
jgi:hypothetical protein